MNSYIFLNSDEIYKFKAKDSKTNAAPSCLGNVVKNYSADNMKNSWKYGSVFDFSVDYDSTDVDYILYL